MERFLDESLARIDREWAALGREPNLGDIVWFVAPRLLPLTARKDRWGRTGSRRNVRAISLVARLPPVSGKLSPRLSG
jgi:hypothetical protein